MMGLTPSVLILLVGLGLYTDFAKSVILLLPRAIWGQAVPRRALPNSTCFTRPQNSSSSQPAGEPPANQPTSTAPCDGTYSLRTHITCRSRPIHRFHKQPAQHHVMGLTPSILILLVGLGLYTVSQRLPCFRLPLGTLQLSFRVAPFLTPHISGAPKTRATANPPANQHSAIEKSVHAGN